MENLLPRDEDPKINIIYFPTCKRLQSCREVRAHIGITRVC